MRLTRQKLAAAGAVAVLALSGCGSDGDGDSEEVPKTATGSLEHLAAEVKCKPNIQTDADTVRQAICKDGDRKFILATFSTDRGQREWINSSKPYGGHFLVGIGAKWVAVGDSKVVTALRGQLGGTMEEGASHHSGSSGGGGTEKHSGHAG
ncbi:hypothetical protein [Streptomyces sporangiiformans]|jgi:hypothetical protein|uniref:Lipoprotein n=1 Tax=Streptomyces sporangiiformans TaxID=2315329 RepID=A0A505DMM5_9ACTN|nr:hypothetical protein [Streptomyces sporangiiformans]TPQ21769.1 hypothetical protein FGD71_013355 [Streptomyces sporangiiformans]